MITEEQLKEWEQEACENISRSYLAEDVSMPSLNWAEINDKILKLIVEIRRLTPFDNEIHEGIEEIYRLQNEICKRDEWIKQKDSIMNSILSDGLAPGPVSRIKQAIAIGKGDGE